MEEKQELEEGGVSIKDIFKTIWVRRWFALAVAVAVFLICAISLFYAYNPSKRYYEMKFSLNLPGTVNGIAYVFPDGTQFYYTDYVSEHTLENVKSSNEAFSDINVASMARTGSISIERETVTDETVVVETFYTLRVKASCFSNEKEAKNFLTTLADAPMNYLKGMIIDYDVYLPIAENAVDYETEIGFLKSQLAVLQREYDQLISLYGGSFVGDENGKTLLAYSQEVKAYVDSGVLDNLISELRTKNLIKSEECRSYYQSMIETLKRERDVKQSALSSIMNPDATDGSVIINIDPSVLALAQEVAELNKQIDALEIYDNGTVSEGFVDEAFETVSNLTDKLTATCANVYSKASSVVYINSGVLSVTGGLGLTMIVFASLVIAVIIALIAGYVAGKIKLSSANAAEKTEEVPTEAVVEATAEEKK